MEYLYILRESEFSTTEGRSFEQILHNAINEEYKIRASHLDSHDKLVVILIKHKD